MLPRYHFGNAIPIPFPPLKVAWTMYFAKPNETWGDFLFYALLLGCILLVMGCDYQSTAINDRMKDFQYTSETLGQEMVTRLKSAHIGDTRKKPSANSRSSKVSQMESDRGGDGDRPDPNSVQAIASDCAAKVKQIEELGGEDGVAETVITQVSGAAEIKENIREAFATSLREELGVDPS